MIEYASIYEINQRAMKKYKTLKNTYSQFPVGTRVRVICVCEDFEFFDGDETGVVTKNNGDYLGITIKFDNGRRNWGFEPKDLVAIFCPTEEREVMKQGEINMDRNRKYQPYYSFSDDGEEVEVRITAKRLGNNYFIEMPLTWVVNEDTKLISVNKKYFEK